MIDSSSDDFKSPTHTGFNESDEHGAVRVSYLDDPNRGFDFDGKYIFYSSRRGFMYRVDVEGEVETRIYPNFDAEDEFDGFRDQPVVSDSKLVARGYDGGGGESVVVQLFIQSVDCSDEKIIDLPYVGPRYIDMSDGLLVWNDMRHWDDGGENVEVYLYDLSKETEKRLSNKPVQQFFPKVSKPFVVWEDYGKGQFREEIVLHNIITDESVSLTDDSTRQIAPEIDGDRVVWTDLRNGTVNPNGTYVNADIYMHNISTQELTQITTEEHDQEYPVIQGNWIAWTDLRFGTRGASNIPDTTNVFAHSIDTHEERQITFGDGFIECCPKIHGDTLVFYSFKTGGYGALWIVDLKQYFN